MTTKSGEDLLFERESYLIRGACFELYNKFGGDFKESIIEEALSHKLRILGLGVENQKKIQIEHLGRKVGSYTPDIIVDNSILIELKVKPYLTKPDHRQFWHYLKASQYRLGFLINFGSKRLEIKRRIYDKARLDNICVNPLLRQEDPRISASKQRGFTLLEVMMVFAILLIVGSGAIFILRNQLLGNLDTDAEAILSRLQEAQSRAMAGVDQLQWGIHFENSTSSAPFYSLVSTSGLATTTVSTFYLSSVVEFEDPTQGFSTDIIFQKLTGTIASSTVIMVRLKTNTADRRQIDVSDKGKISVRTP